MLRMANAMKYILVISKSILTVSVNIVLNMLPSNSFMSCLDYLLGYSTGEFQALQMIALAVFGAVG